MLGVLCVCGSVGGGVFVWFLFLPHSAGHFWGGKIGIRTRKEIILFWSLCRATPTFSVLKGQ